MDGFDLGSSRDASGRFVPGMSGNPAGKRPGTRNRKTVLAEALRDGEDQSVARVVIDQALAGDVVTARFLLGLLSPKPRGRAIELDLPEDARPGDIVAAFDATIAAMAAGEITPDEALTVTRVLDSRRRAALARDPQRPGEAEDARTEDTTEDTGSGTDGAPTASAAAAGEADSVAAVAMADTPKKCAGAGGALHFACKLPNSTTMTSAVALLSSEARAQRTALVTRGDVSARIAAA
jgi:hypothetical protein